MSKHYYEANFSDDLHMPNATDDPNAQRGLLFDENGKLKSQVKLRELNKEELVRHALGHDCSPSYADEDESLQEKSSLTPQQREALGRVGDVIGEVAYDALACFATRAMDAVEARLTQWWHESGAEQVRTWRVGVGTFFCNLFGGNTHRKAEEHLARNEPAMAHRQMNTDKDAGSAHALGEQIVSAYKNYSRNISSAEAQQELFEIIYDASVLARRINRLSQAHVTDDGEEEELDWSEVNELLTGQCLIDGVNRILSGETQPLSDAQIVSFEMFLGRDLYIDGAYQPIDTREYMHSLGLDVSTPQPPHLGGVDEHRDNEGELK